ncbi:chromosome segregation protein SMC [Pseudooceanicola sp. C21-150M6]|uniref:chromosome segregation protein SMC n=1 Tax=Pseudooceanicola sp. C21-150M6 TaxID=3434355 RepID=UPI003D7F62B1
MRFSKLRLTGFKSFVDPTDLLIQDGLTGVVGPNGCGKSNLLEALRWVMGENRPTAMRGGGMEDVIFAGASSRGAKNFAEVALHIDNSERLAPSAFNHADGIEIVRRITRDVGSAYKANGKDVRARDVQMLFADASTGSHSPALVRQGQISELINAKPKSRRRVLEEAAGISGLYQRRHEAELKLNGAEQNLTRVDDVIEGLAQQMQTLERQARQAQRYRAIGAELRRAEGMLLFRRWQEAEESRSVALDALKTAVMQAAQAEKAALDAGKGRAAAEAALPPLREEEAIAGAVLQRLVVERDALSEEETRAAERIEALRARLDQLVRDRDREQGLNRDAGETISRLEWEQRELAKASEGHSEALAAAAETARQAGAILTQRENDLSQLTEDVARLAARHQSAHRVLDDSRRTMTRTEAEVEKARAAVVAAREVLVSATQERGAAENALSIAQRTAQNAEDTLAEADAARGETQQREAEARGARSSAEGEVNALEAETTALARLMQRDTAEGGQVLDAVRVTPGYEQALGAALADDLRAPQVAEDGPSGWLAMPEYGALPGLPGEVRPLADVVTVPEVLRRRIAQIGIIEPEEAARLQPLLKPGQRLVSLEGDLWRWDGYRAWAEDAPSAAAMRLQQMNRLEELKQELARATAQFEGARAAHESLSKRLADLTEADRIARQARRDADRLVSEAARRLNRAEADFALAESRLESVGLSVTRHEEEALAASKQLKEAEKAAGELPDLETARTANEEVKMAVEAARLTMMSRRTEHDELRRDGEARLRRSQEVIKEMSGWRQRLETADKRIGEIDLRRSETEADLKQAGTVPQDLAAKRSDLNASIATAEARKAEATDMLTRREAVLRDAVTAERDAERLASEARESRARAEARRDAAQEAVERAAERIAEEQEMTPKQLLDSLGVDTGAMPRAEAIENDLNRLRRQRDALGAVNLRAEEDAKKVASEHMILSREKDDLTEAIATLRSGIAGLNREGRDRLLAAFTQVNRNFGMLFRHLFGGGEANLVLVESDDPLEAGLEIMCQPPGKKLSVLSLLSGGEQTLTAMALIFAVFLVNPAPICVLDEVDAPLDDANVTRFCDLLDEMVNRADTRFLIITHHAVTMARMDRLFGVTMQEQGVSQLVSVDLKRAEQLVA